MNSDDSRATVLRRTSLVCALLVISVVGLSAYMRLSALGLDCAPWPQCYGQGAAAPSATIDVLRLLHRITATALLPLLLLLLFGGFARKPERWDQRWTAVAAVAITLFLAVLGRWTTGAKVPAVALGNLLGGFALFALCVRMAVLDSQPGTPQVLPAGVRRWRLVAVAALVLQVALGGLVSSGLAGLSCPDVLGCRLPDPVAWQVLNPWHVPSADPSHWPINPQGSLVHLLHRGLAVLTLVLIAVTAWRLRGSRWQRTGLLLLALIALQFLLGVLLVAAGLPLLLALAHNLLAALLLALLLTLP